MTSANAPQPDQERIAALIAGQQRFIQAYAYAICRDFHAAEDVFQEVALVLARQQPPPGEAFLPWIKAIIRHKAVDAVRRHGRTTALDQDVMELMERDADTESNAGDAELRQRLAQCLDRLGGDARRVIIGRYAEDLPCEKLAAELGRSVEAVYAVLKRARQRLGACIEREGAA